MVKRRSKIENVLVLARKLLKKGHYAISNHAIDRQSERKLSIGDIENVIYFGYHNKKKDEYKKEFMDWNYAIEGMTLDDDNARVCIAFDDLKLFIVVTVIRLEVN